MKTALRTDKGTTIVDVSGHIDLASSPDLRKTLLDSLKSANRLAVNLAAVKYIDSSGIASLLEVYKEARTTKKDFVLFNLTVAVNEVLQLTRLNGIFDIRATEEQAVGAC
jgi:anti-sigma B factor antagonist